MSSDERLFRVNQRTPKPCPHRYEMIRKEALQKWEAGISYGEVMAWLGKGAPDSKGALLCASTHQPPIAGQGSTSPCKLLDQLIAASIFLDAEVCT